MEEAEKLAKYLNLMFAKEMEKPEPNEEKICLAVMAMCSVVNTFLDSRRLFENFKTDVLDMIHDRVSKKSAGEKDPTATPI